MICILCGLAPQFFSKARVDKLLCSVNIPWGTRGSFIVEKLTAHFDRINGTLVTSKIYIIGPQINR